MRVAREEGRRRESSEHPSWALGIIWLCEAAPDAAGGSSRAGTMLLGDCGPHTGVQVMGQREGRDPPGPGVLAAESVMVQEGARCVRTGARVCACAGVRGSSVHLALRRLPAQLWGVSPLPELCASLSTPAAGCSCPPHQRVPRSYSRALLGAAELSLPAGSAAEPSEVGSATANSSVRSCRHKCEEHPSPPLHPTADGRVRPR